jgi:hypothetical protein
LFRPSHEATTGSNYFAAGAALAETRAETKEATGGDGRFFLVWTGGDHGPLCSGDASVEWRIETDVRWAFDSVKQPVAIDRCPELGGECRRLERIDGREVAREAEEAMLSPSSPSAPWLHGSSLPCLVATSPSAGEN